MNLNDKQRLFKGGQFSVAILKKIFLTLSIIIYSCTSTSQVKHFGYADAFRLVFDTIESDAPYCSVWQELGTSDYLYYAHRYAQVATNVCDLYGLPDLGIFMRHIKKESRFQWWRTSHKGAVGAMQIRPIFHSGKLYTIQGGKLGRYLKSREREGKTVDHSRYFKRINYNLHVGAALHRQWLDDFGDYAVTLSAYICGPRKRQTLDLIKDRDLLYNKNNRLYSDIREILGYSE